MVWGFVEEDEDSLGFTPRIIGGCCLKALLMVALFELVSESLFYSIYHNQYYYRRPQLIIIKCIRLLYSPQLVCYLSIAVFRFASIPWLEIFSTASIIALHSSDYL